MDCGQAVLHLIFVVLAHYLLMNDLEVVVVIFKACVKGDTDIAEHSPHDLKDLPELPGILELV